MQQNLTTIGRYQIRALAWQDAAGSWINGGAGDGHLFDLVLMSDATWTELMHLAVTIFLNVVWIYCFFLFVSFFPDFILHLQNMPFFIFAPTEEYDFGVTSILG